MFLDLGLNWWAIRILMRVGCSYLKNTLGHPTRATQPNSHPLMNQVCQRLSKNQVGFVVSLVFVFGEFGLKTVRLLCLCMRMWNNIWVLWILCVWVVWYNGYFRSMDIIWIWHDDMTFFEKIGHGYGKTNLLIIIKWIFIYILLSIYF